MLLISEWWASELSVMMGGLLPDAERQLSAIAIYQTTNAICFMLSLGISSAVATRCALSTLPPKKLLACYVLVLLQP